MAKPKKLTLDETWDLCLKMWRWIAKEKRAGDENDVKKLKEEWLQKNYQRYIRENCFFCEYAVHYGDSKACGCVKGMCPGKLVSKRFSCTNKTYDYEYRPIKFYNKLMSLNRKRLKKGRKNGTSKR